VRQTLGIWRREIHHQTHYGAWLVSHPQQSDPAHLDQACKRLGGARKQSSVGIIQMHAIIGDESREEQRSRSRSFKELQR
jgi:hypothetical protein